MELNTLDTDPVGRDTHVVGWIPVGIKPRDLYRLVFPGGGV